MPRRSEGAIVRCSKCRETIQPDAITCPFCNHDIWTVKGRIIRRAPAVFGLGFIALSLPDPGTALSFRIFLGVIGVLLVSISVYYTRQRPVYSLRRPHRPQRRS